MTRIFIELGDKKLLAQIKTISFFDVVGHYARPDIFSLHVNEHSQSPVIHNEG